MVINELTTLALVFGAGLLGSAHCIGMCGPLALALGASENRPLPNLKRQLIYSVGRIFTYTFLGVAAGFSGLWLTRGSSTPIQIQAWLGIIAGLTLLIVGLTTTGVLPRWKAISGPTGGTGGCLAGSWMAGFFNAPGWTNVFLAGIFTGFIPCGLVYAFLAKAVATHSILLGGATMLCFGFGTIPLMVLTGCGGNLLSMKMRTKALKVAAWCVVVAGCMTIARGAGHLNNVADQTTGAGCPLCEAREKPGLEKNNAPKKQDAKAQDIKMPKVKELTPKNSNAK